MSRIILSCLLFAVLCISLVCAGAPERDTLDAVGKPHIFPTRQAQAAIDALNERLSTPSAKPTGSSLYPNGIKYSGGPVMTAPIKVYYIWYGDWANSAKSGYLPVLRDLADGLNYSAWWNINPTYFNSAKVKVTADIRFGGETFVSSSTYGTSLSDSQIASLVSTSISSGKLPANYNGIYLVLTTSDVNAASGFCSSYCGWHTYLTVSNTIIKYGFVGDSARCPSACIATDVNNAAPSGYPGADGMASVIAHELAEAATDPQLNAWKDSRGYENADKCAWMFGTVQTNSLGKKWNVQLGTRQFYIQQNWVNAAGGYCSLKYP